jgi:hypothetical protein
MSAFRCASRFHFSTPNVKHGNFRDSQLGISFTINLEGAQHVAVKADLRLTYGQKNLKSSFS